VSYSDGDKQLEDNPGYVEGQKRRDRITDLVLLGLVALEEVVIRKRLQPCSFPRCQTATLHRVEVYVVVAVLADVRSNGRRRAVLQLHPEAVVKQLAPVFQGTLHGFMCRAQLLGEILELGRTRMNFRVRGGGRSTEACATRLFLAASGCERRQD